VRDGDAHRCQPDAAVARHLGPDAAGRQQDDGAGLAIDLVADQHFGQALGHRLDQRLVCHDTRRALRQVGTQAGQSALQAGAIGHAEHHAADFGLVRDVGRADLHRHRIVERQLGGRFATERRGDERRMGHAQLVQQLIGLGFAHGTRLRRPVSGKRADFGQAQRRAPREHRGDHVGAGFGCAKARHVGGRQLRDGLRRLRYDHGGQRLGASGAVDDGLDGQVRMHARRRADHRHHQIELGCGEHDVERRLHRVVAGTGQRQVGYPARRDLDAGGGELGQCLGRCRLDVDAADAELVHHHRGPAAGGGDDAHAPRGRLAMAQRQTRGQRVTLHQRFQDADPGYAAVLQEGVGDIVLAGQRAGVGLRHFGGGGRAAQFVRDHRLAAPGRFDRERAQRGAVVQALQEQRVAFDAVVVQRRGADLAQAQIALAADRHQAGEADAARPSARDQRADHAAAVRGDEQAANRHVGFGKRGIGRQHQPLARVDRAQAARAEDAYAGALGDVGQLALARRALGPGFGKAAGQHRDQLDAQPGAFGDGRDHGLGRRHQVHMVGHLGQGRERWPGFLALHFGAARIDRVDGGGATGLPQEAQRPSRVLAGVVGGADDGDAARTQQGLGERGAACRQCRHGRINGWLHPGHSRPDGTTQRFPSDAQA